MTESGDDFLSRWSRRKAEVQEQPDEAPEPPASDQKAEQVPDEAEIVAQLPDLESLGPGSDFSVFMKQGVPDALRRQALRKLWKVNPVFSVLDGMNEYDEDYTVVTTLAEGVKTVYQVGKGMVREEEEEEREPEALTEEEPVEAPSEQPVHETAAEDDSKLDEAELDRDQGVAAAAEAEASESGGESELQMARPSGRTATQRRWGAFRT